MQQINKEIGIQKITEYTPKETFILSGQMYKLFKEWIKSKKISPQKQKILNLLNKDTHTTYQELEKQTGYSKPLIFYHIHGNLKILGLKDLEAIEFKIIKRQQSIKLTPYGKLLIDIINDKEMKE